MGCFTVMRSRKKRTQNVSNGLQSTPSSFQSRSVPARNSNSVLSSRARALSAPSSLHRINRDVMLSSAEYDEPRSPTPEPLPLPEPHISPVLKSTGSVKMASARRSSCSSGQLPLPPPSGSLRSFKYEEIASACSNFSPDHRMSESHSSSVYKASIWDASSSMRKLEATVARFYPVTQGLKEFVSEANTLATLQHPNLCKLLGYHAREGTEQRILVYERLHHGSLDLLLYGRSGGPPIDWSSRVKVALCAAQGLTFLHEEGPFQAMYKEFSTANIQIDKDFSAKLSGYGCVGLLPEANFSDAAASGNLSVETAERGLLTPKSNVYSFGIILLELLTGRKNMDNRRPKEERNLIKWSRAFLADGCRLSLIMDRQLKGRFPIEGATTVAQIAQKCLQHDPSDRPTMRSVAEQLKIIQEIKYSCRYPLQEPGAVIMSKQMMRFPSLNGIQLTHQTSLNGYSQSMNLGCSSLLLDEFDRERRKSIRRDSVEGF